MSTTSIDSDQTMALSTSPEMHDFTTVSSNMTSAINISEEERSRYLSHLNYVYFLKMVPVFVFLLIVMVLGLFGNILVLIVYTKKFKMSQNKVFIISLAVFDMITCVVALPGEMANIRYSHTFNYPSICKLFRYATFFPVLSSAFTLVALAIHRYRKICRYHQKQITIRQAKIIVVVVVLVTVVLTIPIVIVNGTKTMITDREGITGYECSFDDKWLNTYIPHTFIGLLFFGFFGCLIVFIVMYILIGKASFSRRKLEKCRSNCAAKVDRRSRKTRMTLMLFMITAVFVVSFLPYLIVIIIRAFNSHFVESLHGAAKTVYRLLRRTYFINSAANCIIYSFCDFNFRNECKKLLGHCLKRSKQNHFQNGS